MNRYYWMSIGTVLISAVVAALFGINNFDTNSSNYKGSKAHISAIDQKFNASSPKMLSQSYKTIFASITADQKKELLAALSVLMKVKSNTSGDADAEFRKQIDGKSAVAIIAAAKEFN